LKNQTIIRGAARPFPQWNAPLDHKLSPWLLHRFAALTCANRY
jgi:hypothetical protein